jgi:exodeoxyribonuclease V alpha subunit
MNRGDVDARSLNIELQAALNPAGDRKVERFGWTFALADKIMQIDDKDDSTRDRDGCSWRLILLRLISS